MIRSLRSLFRRLGGAVAYGVLLVLRSPVDAVLCIINAFFLKNVFGAMEAGDVTRLYESCLWYGIENIGLFLYNGIVWSEFAGFSAKLVGRLRGQVFDTMLGLPMERLEAKQESEWFTRTNSDMRMTLNLLTGALNIPHFVLAVVRITTSYVLLGRISILFPLLELLTLLPHLLLRQSFVASPMERLNKSVLLHTEQTTLYLSAMVECADTVRLYEGEELLLERYRESSLRIVNERMRMNLRKTFGEMLLILSGKGGYLLLFLVGCEMIFADKLDFASLTAAFQFRGAVVAASMMLLRTLVEIRKNTVGLKRLEEIYGENK